MQIVTVQFNYINRPNYAKLLEVFKFSCKLYMPNVEFIEIKTDAPVNRTGRPDNYNYNDFKLKIWSDFLNKTDDNVIFADCDMMCIKSAEHAFNIPFDVAYTQRTIVNKIPMNGGIVMARPTEAARKFFLDWYLINNKMLHNQKLHRQYSKRWAGMNQAAFGYMFQKGPKAKLHEYKTRFWNAVDCDWQHINGNTVFVHYKSRLRKIVLAGQQGYGKYKKAVDLWHAMNQKIEGKKIVKKVRRPRRHPVRRRRNTKV
jgi:hypothetical protein